MPEQAVRPRFISVFDIGIWSYATVVADVVATFEPVISDPESRELAWVPIDAVADYPLHPAFGAAWPALRALLPTRPALVVDAANVVGSVPDGWWKDRAGAAGRLVARLATLAARGIPASVWDLPEETWFPEVHVVLEGSARSAEDVGGVEVVRAGAHGDDAIVETATRLQAAGRTVLVVTSDRALADRVAAVGARVKSVSWLRDLM